MGGRSDGDVPSSLEEGDVSQAHVVARREGNGHRRTTQQGEDPGSSSLAQAGAVSMTALAIPDREPVTLPAKLETGS